MMQVRQVVQVSKHAATAAAIAMAAIYTNVIQSHWVSVASTLMQTSQAIADVKSLCGCQIMLQTSQAAADVAGCCRRRRLLQTS